MLFVLCEVQAMSCNCRKLICLAILTLLCGGCLFPAKATEYKTVSPTVSRNTQASNEENERGLHLAQTNQLEGAERAFRKALESDVSNAAAHNNLGLVHLARHRFYESAVEFRLASKLDRSAIEPVMNLGHLYEIIGWQREAAKQYEDVERLRSSSVNASDAVFGDGRLVDHH